MNSNLPLDVQDALAALSDDERKRITYTVSCETGEYIGVGFIEHGVFTKMSKAMWAYFAIGFVVGAMVGATIGVLLLAVVVSGQRGNIERD